MSEAQIKELDEKIKLLNCVLNTLVKLSPYSRNVQRRLGEERNKAKLGAYSAIYSVSSSRGDFDDWSLMATSAAVFAKPEHNLSQQCT